MMWAMKDTWTVNVTDKEWLVLHNASVGSNAAMLALMSVRAAYAETRGHVLKARKPTT